MEKEIRALLSAGEILEVEKRLESSTKLSVSLKIIKVLVKVFKVEVQNNISNSVFDYSVDMDELIAHYCRLKALMRRLEFDLSCEEQEELYDYCGQTAASHYLAGVILLTSMYKKKKVCQQIISLWTEKGAVNSEYVKYFTAVGKYLEGQKDE